MPAPLPQNPATANEDKMDDSKLKLGEIGHGDVVVPTSEEVDNVEVLEVDEKENRRVLRKIDWNLLPLLCVVYGLQFVSHLRRTLRHLQLGELHSSLGIIA